MRETGTSNNTTICPTKCGRGQHNNTTTVRNGTKRNTQTEDARAATTEATEIEATRDDRAEITDERRRIEQRTAETA